MRSSKPLVLLTLALSPALSGCLVVAGAAAAYGTVQYVNNTVQEDFREDESDVREASADALHTLGYTFVEKKEETDPTVRVFEGHDLEVRLERRARGVVRVQVRVGLFDTDENRRRANVILDEIARQL